MAGLLLILVIVNAAVTGWLLAKVRGLLRESSRSKRVVVVDSDGCVED